MQDAEIVREISNLVEQEHDLERHHGGLELTADEQERLQRVEQALDQCWDLLRQRRARRAAGQDPDSAEVRSRDVVEGYRQ